uniref:Diphthine--ammonia ligase n=2 Tax=Schistosoma mansoni TaxID=6183 RepID=A0A5K4F8B7_SCHMA
MKFVALVSGGKDSIYNIMECIVHGHSLVALVNLCPPKCSDNETSEIDSYMYQSVGSEAIGYISNALEVPLYQMELRRVSHCRRMLYRQCSNDEVEDLYDILCRVLSEIPDVTAVSSGAILSDYQRYRVENVTRRLGLRSLCFLWQRSQEELLEDIVSAGIDAIIIKIAAFGLTVEDFLGVHLSSIAYKLRQLSVPPWSLNVCGEGGEFETVTLDCPIFNSRIRLQSEPEIVTHSKDPFSPTAYLRLRNLLLEAKPLDEVCRTPEQFLSLKGKHINVENTSTHERSPFITPFERLKSISLKTCEEIKGDFINAMLRKTNNNGNNDNQKYDECDRKSINNFARSLGNGMYVTSNYYGTGEKVDEIYEATEDAFSQMKNVFALNEIKPQQIVQFIVVLSQRLSPDVFSSFNEAYTGQLNRWLEEVEIDSINSKTEYIDSYMPTRVCICVNSNAQFIQNYQIKTWY